MPDRLLPPRLPNRPCATSSPAPSARRVTVEPEIHGYRPHPGDLYLLASDGLTRELTDEAIAEILNSLPANPKKPELHVACKALIDAANESGGADNITVLFVAIDPA